MSSNTFIWQGTTSAPIKIEDKGTSTAKCRWKIDRDVVNMKKTNGGIGLCNLKQACIKAAIGKILTWDIKPTTTAKWAGEFLQHNEKVTAPDLSLIIPTYFPTFKKATRNIRSRVKLTDDVWSYGTRMLEYIINKDLEESQIK